MLLSGRPYNLVVPEFADAQPRGHSSLTYAGSNLTDYTTIITDTLKRTGLTYIGSNYANLSSGNPLGGRKTAYIIECTTGVNDGSEREWPPVRRLRHPGIIVFG